MFVSCATMVLLLICCDAKQKLVGYVTDEDLEWEVRGWLPFDYHQYTTALHGMHESRKYRFHPVVNPIYTSATFQQREPGADYGFVYSRIGNPTRESLERVLAALDYARYANAFPSGMSAIFAMLKMLTPEDHIVCSDDVFDGTHRYVADHNGIEFDATFVNPTIEEFVAAVKPNTKMMWVESPSNPVLKVTDIPGLVRAVKNINPEIIIVMDNTFLGPFFQKGLRLGADVVVYSLSKYMNGHGDVLMGAAITNNRKIHEYLTSRQQFSGLIPSPFDCYQVMRGLKTLPIRMLQHWKNGIRIAMWLEKNPYIEAINYPGLRSQSRLPRKMWSGMSGMMSFKLKNFSQNMTRDFLGELKYFRVAWSLGTVESLAEQPFVMLDTSFPEAVRKKLGVTPNLVRLSVGLEYYQDLIDDLDQAMKAVAPEGPPLLMDERPTETRNRPKLYPPEYPWVPGPKGDLPPTDVEPYPQPGYPNLPRSLDDPLYPPWDLAPSEKRRYPPTYPDPKDYPYPPYTDSQRYPDRIRTGKYRRQPTYYRQTADILPLNDVDAWDRRGKFVYPNFNRTLPFERYATRNLTRIRVGKRHLDDDNFIDEDYAA